MRSRAARFCGSLVFLVFVMGCSGPVVDEGSAPTSPPTSKKQPGPAQPVDENDAPPASMQMRGAGGVVELMDASAKVKRCFPLPRGAKPGEKPEFLASGQEHWGWTTNEEVFDAIFEEDKVVWMSHFDKALSTKERAKAVSDALDLFGEPAENAESKAATVFSWERGDAVRVMLNLNSPESSGLLVVVGKARVLQNHLPLGSLGELVRNFEVSQ